MDCRVVHPSRPPALSMHVPHQVASRVLAKVLALVEKVVGKIDPDRDPVAGCSNLGVRNLQDRMVAPSEALGCMRLGPRVDHVTVSHHIDQVQKVDLEIVVHMLPDPMVDWVNGGFDRSLEQMDFWRNRRDQHSHTDRADLASRNRCHTLAEEVLFEIVVPWALARNLLDRDLVHNYLCLELVRMLLDRGLGRSLLATDPVHTVDLVRNLFANDSLALCHPAIHTSALPRQSIAAPWAVPIDLSSYLQQALVRMR